MEVNSLPMRGDFRCGVCRQKNTFHCEHDTPYRDQYLEVFNTNTARTTHENGSRSRNNSRTMNTGRTANPNAGAQSQNNGKKHDNTHVNDTTTTTNEQNKPTKSCVIL